MLNLPVSAPEHVSRLSWSGSFLFALASVPSSCNSFHDMTNNVCRKLHQLENTNIDFLTSVLTFGDGLNF